MNIFKTIKKLFLQELANEAEERGVVLYEANVMKYNKNRAEKINKLKEKYQSEKTKNNINN